MCELRPGAVARSEVGRWRSVTGRAAWLAVVACAVVSLVGTALLGRTASSAGSLPNVPRPAGLTPEILTAIDGVEAKVRQAAADRVDALSRQAQEDVDKAAQDLKDTEDSLAAIVAERSEIP